MGNFAKILYEPIEHSRAEEAKRKGMTVELLLEIEKKNLQSPGVITTDYKDAYQNMQAAVKNNPKELQRQKESEAKAKENAAKAFSGILGMSMPSTYYNLFNLDNLLSDKKALALDLGATALLGGYGLIKLAVSKKLAQTAFENQVAKEIAEKSTAKKALKIQLYEEPIKRSTGKTAFFYEPGSGAKVSTLPRYERTAARHSEPKGPYYDYSLINRSRSQIGVDEYGRFVFESPEKANKLATVHFTFNEPVVSHSGGGWDDASTTILVPYRNVRSQTAPINLDIMDTFFPNYRGLKISTRGSKALTGDRKIYDYYKSKGLDVTFSKESEDLVKKILELQETEMSLPYDNNDLRRSLDEEIRNLSKQNDQIHRNWALQHSKPIPNYRATIDLAEAEGLLGEWIESIADPVLENTTSYLTPLQKKLGYYWYDAPTTHHILTTGNLEYKLKSLLGSGGFPEREKFLRWLILGNKSDPRFKAGGSLNYLKYFK